ncbi:glycosyltransferase [Hydrogenothermus marinus]|uniref:Glycosyltransferase involved in cell wall biosynthesis n=1 Tax=Hydrogenothermus marinus TaxID=133270 RepID=A0A3M0B7E1_9AQUI|nr:glycosyltransferase [Hydrogenothermus marinus]RMA93303.1 glycosyltransferase involved in cell wall biosynthesis [Hydrogenothermus marinus]
MKIVHIIESFAGGSFSFLVKLTNKMSNNEHIIIHGIREDTPKNFQKYFPEKTKFYKWNSAVREINPKKDFLALIELVRILKSINDIDVIHLHSSKAGFLGRLSAKILGYESRVIYTSHGVSFLREDISKFKKKIFISLEKLAYLLGGQVIACSKSESEIFNKYGIQAKYINNGIDCNSNILRNKKKLNEILIGTVGRITYAKNPQLFNQIAKKFLYRKDVKFLWIGDGELRKELNSPNIKITGWVDLEKVKNYLIDLDIYISTSLWEGLPLSVLEAMCFSKPLILSNCVGNKDLVISGYNGFLFNNFKEAIEKLNNLIENKSKLEILGLNSKKLVKEKFTIDKMVKEYENLYKTISKNY